MTIQTLLIVFGLVLALIGALQADGRSLLAWAVVFVTIALLWGKLS